MSSHLLALLVVVPLCAAPICVLIRHRRTVEIFASVTGWAVFGIALTVLQQVSIHGAQSYAMGGWPAPWGIEYRVDLLAAFVAAFVSLIGAVCITYSPASLSAEVPKDRHYLFYSAFLLAMTGLLGITVTGDLFNLFVFLEISSLPSYALISLGRSRRALTAAFQYLVMGTLGATFILIAIGLIYMMTGSLNMADVASRIGPVSDTGTVLVAFAFLSVGLALKAAVFPLHLWLPSAYTFAPSVVSAFLAATATKVALYTMIRFTTGVFDPEFSYVTLPLATVLTAAGLSAMFMGSTVAIFQMDLKRLLAYSSVAQIGYIVLGISFGTTTGLAAGIVHLFNHGVTKGGMFLAAGCFLYRIHSVEMRDLRGVGRTMPWTTLLFVLGGLSLIGVPGTAGFVSKWYLVRAALEMKLWVIAVLILLSSLLAVCYVWRFVENAYFRKPESEAAKAMEAPLSLLIPTAGLIGLSIYFGVRADWTAGLAERAAAALHGGAL